MPIITDAERIQLVLETLGIEGIKAGELAYDRLEKQIKEVEKAEGTLQQQARNLTSTEYELVEATNEQSKASRERAAAQYAASKAVEESVEPTRRAAEGFGTFGQRRSTRRKRSPRWRLDME